MVYREIIATIITQAILSYMEKQNTAPHSLFVPPRRRKYKLTDKVGTVFLPYDSVKTLNTLAGLYNFKPVEIAELLLQAILNSIPVIEMLGKATIDPNELVELLADSLTFDVAKHK